MNLVRLRPRLDPSADHVLRVLQGLVGALVLGIIIVMLVELVGALGWWFLLAPFCVAGAISVLWCMGTIMEWLFDL